MVTEQVEQLASRARQLAALGQLQGAREQWMAVLNLLPVDAPERAGVLREVQRLDARLAPKPVSQKPASKWSTRLGPLGLLVAFLAKFKFLLSIFAFVGIYWTMFGWWFAVGLTGSVLIHEMGHFVAVRSFGFKAELPMFLPGLGAYVKWQGANVDPRVRALISLAGPFFGFLSGILAYGIFLSTHQGVWLAVAQFAGWLNLINLVPVSILDGGAVMNALGAQHRLAIAVVCTVLAFVLGEYAFLFVAAGAGYRLYKRDYPALSDQSIAYAFLALAILNGLLSWFCSNQARLLFGHTSF